MFAVYTIDPMDPIDPIDSVDPIDPIDPKRLGEPLGGSRGNRGAWGHLPGL